jgi:signal transduction histidine kinase
LLAAAIDALTAQVAVLDERGRILAVNAGWRRFADENGLGDPQHGLQRSYLEVCEAPGAAGTAGPPVARAIRGLSSGRDESFSLDYSCPTPAGESWFEVRLTPLQAHGLLRILVVHEDVTHRKRALDDMRRLDAKLQQHANEERRRIAGELHDTTGQELSAAVMLIGRSISTLPSSSEIRPLLDEALGLCRKSLDDVRTLSYELRPPLLDGVGLPEALRWYARLFSRRSGVQVEVDAPRDLQRRSPRTELALFRVAQEALLNVKRHSGAGTAAVRLTCAGEAIELEVRDDGGLAAEPHEPAELLAGQGTQSMHDRIHACGGTVTVSSDPTGTLVRARAPILPEGNP